MNSSATNKTDFATSGSIECFTGKDGTQHFLRCWSAENPTAYILYLHGIEGHSLWFQDTAIFLAKNGISTIALDRRGSGLSKEPRGDAKSWKQLLDDSSEVLQEARKKAGTAPLFLFANCWGAKLAAVLAEKQKAESKLICGLIFSSPAIEVKVDLPLAEKLQVAWRCLCGSKKPLRIPLELCDFTDNPVYLKFIEDDSLRLIEASASFLLSTFVLTQMSKRSAAKIELPVLLLQSGTDSIVDGHGVQNWFGRLSSADKTFSVFPGVFHSLDFHHDPDEYRQVLLSWISSHLKVEKARL